LSNEYKHVVKKTKHFDRAVKNLNKSIREQPLRFKVDHNFIKGWHGVINS